MSQTEDFPEYIPPSDPDPETELPRPAKKDAGDGEQNPGPGPGEEAPRDKRLQDIEGETGDVN